jgi:hypothetical protein
MPITDGSHGTISRHWLRMPAPHSGENFELFIFSGIAIFNNLKGTGSSWDGGDARIDADYSNVIPQGQAILPRHWTVDVHLASIFNANTAINTGWSVNNFSLARVENGLGGDRVAAVGGNLRLRAGIAVRDIDAFIHRLSYNVTILGKPVDFEDTIIE